MEAKNCKQCGQEFQIFDSDLKFYERISPIISGKKYPVPVPTFCPDCRQQRRLSFRNERNLYHRKSDLSHKQIITMYAPKSPYLVYDQEEWWSDKFDPLAYGMDYDFNKSFFEQFKRLMLKVPRISLINREHANSEYCNFALKNKDSYLLFTCGFCDECYYSNRSFRSRNIFDCSNVNNCELCYELLDSDGCYGCYWGKNLTNCSDCVFGRNLIGCKNCFGCFGLANKSYCIGNIQYSQEEYEQNVAGFMKDLSKSKADYFEWLKKMPRRFMEATTVENCTGDSIYNSKNSKNCFEVMELLDCKFICNATHLKDCYDVNNDDNSELVYECVGSESNYQHCFNDICWFNSEMYYCSLCFNSKNCFGCTGLKKHQYCILNKQYTKEQYQELVPKIIEKMQAAGEWGEFFPMEISPFAYNESMAQDYFPLSKDEILAKGWRWKDEEEDNIYRGPKYKISEDINQVTEDLCKQILTCDVTCKPYKILPKELAFYKKQKLPIPKKCPDQRHTERLGLRNPRKLWERKCDKCGAGIITTYNPSGPETVYCDKCYLETVY